MIAMRACDFAELPLVMSTRRPRWAGAGCGSSGPPESSQLIIYHTKACDTHGGHRPGSRAQHALVQLRRYSIARWRNRVTSPGHPREMDIQVPRHAGLQATAGVRFHSWVAAKARLQC